MARKGRKVLVLEREAKFKDRVRGENILPWGVAVARRCGFVDDLAPYPQNARPGKGRSIYD
jgi:2-polyprenyl-6-methoxyphenol hydroxylase-like FAD-dependent oxidoreductase